MTRESNLCVDGGQRHTWEPNHPLEVDGKGRLVNVRSCLRCGRQESKGYGGGRPRTWTAMADG